MKRNESNTSKEDMYMLSYNYGTVEVAHQRPPMGAVSNDVPEEWAIDSMLIGGGIYKIINNEIFDEF